MEMYKGKKQSELVDASFEAQLDQTWETMQNDLTVTLNNLGIILSAEKQNQLAIKLELMKLSTLQNANTLNEVKETFKTLVETLTRDEESNQEMTDEALPKVVQKKAA